MKYGKDVGCVARIIICGLVYNMIGLSACGRADAEMMIVPDLEIEGDADKVLSLENDCELWMRTGNGEDNYGQLRAYIINNASGEIIPLSLEDLEAAVCLEQEPLWEYRDMDEDGKADISITGTFQLEDGTEVSGIWIYRQTSDGDYELWEDGGRMKLMRKIA